MAVLPTGFGKSLIYQIIPKVLECLKNESNNTQKFIVCVVSPLEYIRKQQVASINKLHGLSAAAVGDNEETDKDIEDGGANIVFGSAEEWLSDKCKKALQFGSLHEAEFPSSHGGNMHGMVLFDHFLYYANKVLLLTMEIKVHMTRNFLLTFSKDLSK